jgi:cytochrome P450/NADPH-cytochrome P450 reductase
MTKLRAEIDDVLGDRMVTLDDIPKLPYLTAVIRETMRLFPPVTARVVVPIEDTTLLGGKYAVKAGEVLRVSTVACQRDTAVYGDNVRVGASHMMFIY